MKKHLLLIMFFAFTIKSNAQTITDVDGNTYNTITIGTQVWMKENLKVTKYSNGDAIETTNPLRKNISSEVSPKYQWVYDGNANYLPTYGRLYTWYAASDSRNVCPTGWHLPTDDDWTSLSNYLIANGYNYDGTTTGNKIAKVISASTTWTTSASSGSPGNTDYPNKQNVTDFSAVAAGYCETNFMSLGNGCYFWSSLESDANNAWSVLLINTHPESNRISFNKYRGFSVRCLKDNTTSINTASSRVNRIVFASPVTHTLIIDNIALKSIISVFSTGGKLYKTTIAANPHTEIPVSDLPKGVYLLKVNDSVSKFVKL